MVLGNLAEDNKSRKMEGQSLVVAGVEAG